jgi:hypothetical protein
MRDQGSKILSRDVIWDNCATALKTNNDNFENVQAAECSPDRSRESSVKISVRVEVEAEGMRGYLRASAPPTMSMSSFVIADCLVLL